jgi:hypothetical protein
MFSALQLYPSSSSTIFKFSVDFLYFKTMFFCFIELVTRSRRSLTRTYRDGATKIDTPATTVIARHKPTLQDDSTISVGYASVSVVVF